jgi:Trk K+ transport system NAD-binding subunit
VELVEQLLQTGRESLELEEFVVKPSSSLVNVDLASLRSRFPDGPAVVAVRSGGRLLKSPSGDYRLRAGDELVLVGSPGQLHALEDLI